MSCLFLPSPPMLLPLRAATTPMSLPDEPDNGHSVDADAFVLNWDYH
jgi:hypothetical protein